MRLDIARFVRYARARVYAIAVRIHAAVYFGGSLGTRTPMPFDCETCCEVVGEDRECLCLVAPFTGTPYNPAFPDDNDPED